MARLLWRGLTLGCAVCAKRGLFRRMGLYRMRETCPRCGLKFERTEGHWLGAVAVNTVVSSAMVLISLAAAMVILGTTTDRGTLLFIVIPFATAFPVLFDPASRTLWTAVDIAMRPAGPDEVDVRFARTAGGELFMDPTGSRPSDDTGPVCVAPPDTPTSKPAHDIS